MYSCNKFSGYLIYIRHLRIIINELVDEELLSQKDYPFGKYIDSDIVLKS